MDEGFGEIRSLLHAEPSEREESWEHLLTSMQRAHAKHPDVVVEEWLPYVLEGLEEWSDSWRVAPRPWMNALRRGKDVGPLLALARSVDASRVTLARFEQMCVSERFGWARHLRFAEYKFKPAHGRALGASSSFASLTSLEFVRGKVPTNASRNMFKNPFTSRLRKLVYLGVTLQPKSLGHLRSGTFQELESLVVEGCVPSVAGAGDDGHVDWSVLPSFDLPRLRHLSLACSWYGPESLEALLTMPGLARLEWLDLRRAPAPFELFDRYDIERYPQPDHVPSEVLVRELDVERRLVQAGVKPEVAAQAVASILREYAYEPAP